MKSLITSGHKINFKKILFKATLIVPMVACILVSIGNLGIPSVEASPAATSMDHTVPITINNNQSLTASAIETYSVGTNPLTICFDGANVWVANYGSNGVTKLRASDGANLGTYPAGSPADICFDGTNVWVTDYFSNTVTKLRASDGTNLGTYPTGSGPHPICFDGANIWVVNHLGNSVTKIRASDGKNLGTFTVGTQPYGICFDGINIWVTNYLNNTVTKLMASDGTNPGTFAVGTHPAGICFDGTNIWVANFDANDVTKLRASDGSNLGTYAVGTNPSPYGICFDGSDIWVANLGSDNVVELNASDGVNEGTYEAGNDFRGICFDGTDIWVANWSSDSVTELKLSPGANDVSGITSPSSQTVQPRISATTMGNNGNITPNETAQNPPFAFKGAYATYQFSGTDTKGSNVNGEVTIKVTDVDKSAQTFNFTMNNSAELSGLDLTPNNSASLSNPAPFTAVGQSDLQALNQGQAPEDFSGGTVTTGVLISVPAGKFKTDEIATPDGTTAWIDMNSGLLIKVTGDVSIGDKTIPAATMVLQSTNIATSKSFSFIIIIIAVVVVVVIAGVVTLLMVHRRKSKKGAMAGVEPVKETGTTKTPLTRIPGVEVFDPADRLKQLKVMLDKGLITQQDYDEQKKKILEEYLK